MGALAVPSGRGCRRKGGYVYDREGILLNEITGEDNILK
jgi:hypothetical protein